MMRRPNTVIRSDRKPATQLVVDNSCPEPNSGCWLWTGYTNKWGYGRVGVPQARAGERLAHRISFVAFVGPINTRLLMHRCDTPACVNPAHLRPGTDAENNRDMMLKGRRRGPKHPNAKLSPSIAKEVRSSRDSVSDLAQRFGVSRRAIQYVKDGVTWAS